VLVTIAVVVAAVASWVEEVVMGMGFRRLCNWRRIETHLGELQFFLFSFFFFFHEFGVIECFQPIVF
jgi:hypothetical protein